jgi:diguanylate cyclase (GGDEF)-like protein
MKLISGKYLSCIFPMPTLDYHTLFIILIMNSAIVAVIWGGVALAYRDFHAARHWMAGSLLTCFGALLLLLQYSIGGAFPAVAGNFLIIAGFWLFYTGLLDFYGIKIYSILRQLVVIMSISLFAALAEYSNWLWLAAVHGLTYLAALVCMFIFLAARRHKSPGAYVCLVAVLLGIACQAYNLYLTLRISAKDIDVSYFLILYAYNFLVMQFSAGLLTFGFFILTIDALRKEVERLAGMDDLTGLPTRKRFNDVLSLADQQFKDNETPYALLLIDVDHFKSFNDDMGHRAGDVILKHFGKTVSSLLKVRQIMSRHGGDEFCILLPASTKEQAETLAKRIKEKLSAVPITVNTKPVFITVSIGIALRNSETPDTVETDIFDEADKALYQVKRNGRDGYAFYHAGVSA